MFQKRGAFVAEDKKSADKIIILLIRIMKFVSFELETKRKKANDPPYYQYGTTRNPMWFP